MENINKIYLYILIAAILLAIAGCATYLKPSTLKFEGNQATGIRSSNQITPNITLDLFQDTRDKKNGPEVIGGKKGGLGLPTLDVSVEIPIAELIYNKFSRELLKNEYDKNNGDSFKIGGEISKFWIGTDVTALYWDVYGEVEIKVEINNSKGESIQIGPYYSKNVERTYTGPSDEIMMQVILSSIDEVIKNIISDNKFITMISKTKSNM